MGFKIERMEQFLRPMTHDKRQSVEKLALVIRSGVEGIIKQHLGSEFIDQIFNLYTEKLIESELFSSANYVPMFDLFIFLKRI
ncbi:SAM dependent carboxyl methyltransferase [Melia azedarach]|uniref:SAM dependent carboxyl methyltransferase n=1 Tax=Melia azedarach TaxID=155640 RepID=A0ACC1XF16_MELAZ|nr:SAM dependent carboxyl methyltransferase [Melia azedarach]